MMRAALALLFAATGALHFIKTAEMTLFLPPGVPFREGIVHFTGALEVAGAFGLLSKRWVRPAGIGLMLLLVAVFPANVYGAFQRVDLAGHGAGPAYLWLRAPLQVLLILCVYFAAVRDTPRRQV